MAQDRDLTRIKQEAQEAIKRRDWISGSRLLKEWCRLKPNDSMGWYYRAFLAVKRSQLEYAKHYLDRSLSIEPRNKNARKLYTLVQDRLKREEALPTADTMRTWREGSVLDGRYELRGSKKGGMGEVYFAFDRELDHMVAIKAPLATATERESYKRRLFREAEAWIGLGVHPNICSAYYVQEIDNNPWLFVEYVDGGTLDEWLKERNLPFLEKLDIAIQIASGMNHTHTFLWRDDRGNKHRGLVHRDLKPANILMDGDGTPRVTDFGLVGLATDQAARESMEDTRSLTDITELLEARKAADQRTVENAPGGEPGEETKDIHWNTITVAGEAAGTPPYMAPEQWTSAHVAGTAADIYAFGCLLYDIFCQRRPYILDKKFVHAMPAVRMYQWEMMHLNETPPDPRTINPDLPDTLADLMLWCLNKKPGDRPESFHEIREILKAVYAQASQQPYHRPNPSAFRLLADSLNNQGVSYMTIGQVRRAEAAWRDALRTDPHHIEATYNMLMFEWEEKAISYEEAFRRMEEVGRTYTSNWRQLQLMAKVCMFFGEYAKAVAYLQQAAETPNAGLRVHRDLALAMCAEAGTSEDPGQWLEIENLLDRVLAQGYENPVVITGYALALKRQGRERESSKFYSEKARLHGDMSPSLDESIHRILPGQENIATLFHQGWVNYLHFSRDGKRVLVGSENKIGLWPIRLPGPKKQDAAGSDTHRATEAALRVWDVRASKTLKENYISGGQVLSVCTTPDDSRVITGHADGGLALWALEENTCLRKYKGGHPYGAEVVVFSPDGKYFLSGGADGRILVWETDTGEQLDALEGHTEAVTALSFCPDGKYVLSGSMDSTIRYWDSYTGDCLFTFSGHGAEITGLAVDSKGILAVSASKDRTLRLWDLPSGACRHVYEGHLAQINAVAFSADDKHIISGSHDRTLRFWDVGAQRLEKIYHFENRIECLTVSRDGRLIALAYANTQPSDSKSIALIAFPSVERYRVPYVVTLPMSASEADERQTEFQNHLEDARRLLAHKDYKGALDTLNEARAIAGYQHDDEALALWDKIAVRFPGQSLRTAWECETLQGHDEAVTAVALNAQTGLILSGSQDKTLRLWNLETGAHLKTLTGHLAQVTVVALYESGTFAVSGSSDYTLRIWDLTSGVCLRAMIEHGSEIMSLAVSRDGRLAASGDREGRLVLWDLHGQNCIRGLEGHADCVAGLAFSPDGRYLASGSWDKTVRIWDLESGLTGRLITGHGGPVTGVAFSPDGLYIVSGCRDGIVRRWELFSDTHPDTLIGHEGSVTCLAFSSDGAYILTGGEDKTLKLWNFKSGKAIRTFAGHAGKITGIAFNLDRRMAVSSSVDGTLRLWQFNWEPDIREETYWVEEIRPYLEQYLTLHSPYPTGKLVRSGKPEWDEDDIQGLLKELTNRGFGWITPEGIQAKLTELAKRRKSPSRLWQTFREIGQGIKMVFMPIKYLKKPFRFVLKLVPAGLLGLIFWKMGFWGDSKIKVFIAAVLVAFAVFIMTSKPRKR